MTQVLILEPDASSRAHLRSILESNGFSVAEPDLVGLEPGALDSLDVSTYPCVVASAERCAAGGRLDVLTLCTRVPVILIAHKGDVRQAVTAMKRGVCDYLIAPFEPDELAAAVERCMTERPLHGPRTRGNDFPMVGDSRVMRELYDRIAKVGPTDSPVLVRGESGTGKELVARALHAASDRARAPMISLNCATVPPRILETELFGYSPSEANPEAARSGLLEAANGGTLFLDEVGELTLEAQARLLRVLQAGELRRFGSTQTFPVNVRLITATHRDLDNLIVNGQFRKDLFYRLNVVTLDVPPLRERGDDVLKLAEFILDRAREKVGKHRLHFEEETRLLMLDYSWPGNVRELENAIERAVILCDSDAIEPALLAVDTTRKRPPEAPAAVEQTSLEDYFVSFVLSHQDSLTETELAEKLGISRKSLWERRQRLNIPRKRTRQRGPRRESS